MRPLLSSFAFAVVMMTGAAHADEQLAVALEQAGYFVGLSPGEAATLRADIVANGYTGAMHPTRIAPADTPALAAGGVGAWVRDTLRPVLAYRGVTFRPAEDHYAADGSTYSVAIGTWEYQMWQAGETNTEQASTNAAFGMVNSLLEAIRSPQRLYLVGQGATAQAWLLSPAQADIIRSVAPPEAWPHLPSADRVTPTLVATPTVAALSTGPQPALIPAAAPAAEDALANDALANEAAAPSAAPASTTFVTQTLPAQTLPNEAILNDATPLGQPH